MMQLGTRWSVGDTPPATLPAAVLAAIIATEAELSGVDTATWRWTLTWLERKPIVQLDDGTTLRFDPATNEVTTTQE
jgi:hypothetical protein